MLKKLIIYRHGERSDLAPIERQIDYNIRHDPPLTLLGHEQAEFAAMHIQSLFQNSDSQIKLISSPMLRCIQTISKLSNLLNKPVHLQDGFSEAFQEEFKESPFSTLYSRHVKNEFPLDIKIIEEIGILVPKVPESLEESAERMKVMIEKYFDVADAEIMVVCTHLYPIWGLVKAIGEDYDDQNAKFTQIFEYIYEDNNLKLITNGYAGHLDAISR